MVKLAEHSLCTGCTACVSVCTMQCLKMIENAEGFLYPQLVNREDCISCHKCERVCPILHEQNSNEKVEAFAAYSKNDKLRAESSSGGIFSEVSLEILFQGGCIYGAAYNEIGGISHICVEKKEDLGKLRGAKYAQSQLNDCFIQIKKRLKDKQIVLFSGTPCQVSGLKNFLEKEYENLFCIDFVCHGIPSPLVWNSYIKWCVGETDEEVIIPKINLRDKRTGWSYYKYSTVIESNKKKISCLNSQNIFMKLFVEDYINRVSCAECRFKGYNRESDITLGDFWGIWDIAPEMDDDKGTSLVLLHSNKGKEIWNRIIEKINLKRVTLEEASAKNPSLLVSSLAKENRAEILQKAMRGEFDELEKQFFYCTQEKVDIFRRVKNKLSNFFSSLLR